MRNLGWFSFQGCLLNEGNKLPFTTSTGGGRLNKVSSQALLAESIVYGVLGKVYES